LSGGGGMSGQNANVKEVELRQIISQLFNLIDDELWDNLNGYYQEYVTEELNKIEERLKEV
tara:strand:- start:193 stop:375 length:183 start_codon:yes stop_codon:yes gene_type:complete